MPVCLLQEGHLYRTVSTNSGFCLLQDLHFYKGNYLISHSFPLHAPLFHPWKPETTHNKPWKENKFQTFEQHGPCPNNPSGLAPSADGFSDQNHPQAAWGRNQPIMGSNSSPPLCKEVGARFCQQHSTLPYCKCPHHHFGTYKEVYEWIQRHYLLVPAQEDTTRCPSSSLCLTLFPSCSNVMLHVFHRSLKCLYSLPTILQYFEDSENNPYICIYVLPWKQSADCFCA